jgi:hypothetical protein
VLLGGGGGRGASTDRGVDRGDHGGHAASPAESEPLTDDDIPFQVFRP